MELAEYDWMEHGLSNRKRSGVVMSNGGKIRITTIEQMVDRKNSRHNYTYIIKNNQNTENVLVSMV